MRDRLPPASVLDALPESIGVGVDNSSLPPAGPKVHPRASAVVADIWDGLPIKDRAAGLILNVFSPRNGEEIERILAPAAGWSWSHRNPDTWPG